MAKQRTTHHAPTHIPRNGPVVPDGYTHPIWGHGADGPPPGEKAADEDRKYKQAYGIKQLRSPYLHMLDLPQRVQAGDRAVAFGILGNIDRALEIRGRWTQQERTRLRRLRERWGRRAAGEDTYFNLRGWVQAQVGPGREGYASIERDRRIAEGLDQIRQTITGDDSK